MKRALLLLAVVLFAVPVFSAGEDDEPVAPVISFDPVLSFFGGIYDSMAAVPQAVVDAFFAGVRDVVAGFVAPLFGLIKELMLRSIEPLDHVDLWLLVVTVISLCYGLLFLLVGFKFLLGSYDAVQRAQAKEWLKNAVVLVVAVNASLILYSLLLGLSSGMASFLWSSQLEPLLELGETSALNLLWVVVLAFSSFFAVISLFMRQVFLVAGIMLFPIGIFLYLIPPVRAFGYSILAVLVTVAFMPVIDVIVLTAVNLVVLEFAGFEIIGLLGTAIGLLLICVVNCAMFWLAILSGLGKVSHDNPQLVSAGKFVVQAVAAGV